MTHSCKACLASSSPATSDQWMLGFSLTMAPAKTSHSPYKQNEQGERPMISPASWPSNFFLSGSSSSESESSFPAPPPLGQQGQATHIERESTQLKHYLLTHLFCFDFVPDPPPSVTVLRVFFWRYFFNSSTLSKYLATLLRTDSLDLSPWVSSV